MLTKVVFLSKINLNDKQFQLFDSDVDISLENSISELGLINPVKLLEKEGKYIVVTGWKRIKALHRLNIQDVYSQVCKEGDLSREQLLKLIYMDNKERFSELEKAELLKMLYETNNKDEKRIINEYLPLFGLNPSLNNFKKYHSIASIEDCIKEAYLDEVLTIEQLHMLSEISESEMRCGIFKNFLKEYKFNNNELRELIKDIQQICNRHKISIEELAQNVFSDTNNNLTKNEIRAGIKKICYPKLSKIEALYQDMVKDLQSGEKSRLVNHPYFESNEVEFRVRFGSKDELLDEINNIKRDIDEGRIERLLNLIKEGV